MENGILRMVDIKKALRSHSVNNYETLNLTFSLYACYIPETSYMWVIIIALTHQPLKK